MAVLVSGGGTNLQALIDAEASGIIKSGRISLVISSKPGVYALERAKKAGIPATVVPRASLSQEDFESGIRKLLDEYGIGLIILAGFMSILSPEFTSKYP
ncbi:MAG: phosphoribosylglycinamide formyltransferase, partial [Clostridia bacterium]|nr:phosphoribosylglycinamide formyltransferase [Clostridia bacterium]